MASLYRSTTDQQIILFQPPPLGQRLVEVTMFALPVLLFIALYSGVVSNIAPPVAPTSLTFEVIWPTLTSVSLSLEEPPYIEQISRRDSLRSLSGQTTLEAVQPLFQPHADNLAPMGRISTCLAPTGM